MPIILTKKSKKIFPEGKYQAKLEKIELEPSKFDPEKQTAKLQFKTDYRPKANEASWNISLSCTASLHEKSRLHQIVENISGQHLKDGENFDLESMIGKQCIIQVEHQSSDEGKLYAKIVEVWSVEEELREAGYEI